MSKLTLLYIFLSICICTASFFILRNTTQPVKITPKTVIASYAIDATYTEYNAQGLIKTSVDAKKITRYLPQGNSIFEKPFIVTYAADRTPWHIHADSGESDRTGEKIILQGHVIIHELPTSTHPETMIQTAEITLFPKLSRAETNAAVILSRPGMTIYGKGLLANLKTGQYELKSQSKAVYQPNNQQSLPKRN
jgi:lipopolysaccharide export system protein LptC